MRNYEDGGNSVGSAAGILLKSLASFRIMTNEQIHDYIMRLQKAVVNHGK